jgi:hypothetical protein
MAHPLRLHHELLLLCLHDEKGTNAFGSMIETGLAGAVLGELMLEGRVETRPEGRKGKPLVTVVDHATLGDDVLDAGLRRLREATRRADLRRTVQGLARIKDIRARTAVALCRRGILREDEGRVLWLFKRRIYPTVDPAPERALVARVRAAVEDSGGEVAPRTALLVTLARTTGALKAVYSSRQIKAHGERLDALKELGGEGSRAARAAVEAMEAAEAAMVAMMAATAAASATT